MEKLIKIAEVNAQSKKSVKKIAEILEQNGFIISYNEDEGYESYFDILEKNQ